MLLSKYLTIVQEHLPKEILILSFRNFEGEWDGMDRDSDWENSKVSNALMLYPCRRSQIYRFISLAFAHRGLTHLFANCILTLWFGKIIKSASNSA